MKSQYLPEDFHRSKIYMFSILHEQSQPTHRADKSRGAQGRNKVSGILCTSISLSAHHLYKVDIQ